MSQVSLSDKYSDVFIHFVNAKTAHEAIGSFFSDIQIAFNLPRGFAKKAKKAFPGLPGKLNLTSCEEEYLHLINRQSDLYQIIYESMEGSYLPLDDACIVFRTYGRDVGFVFQHALQVWDDEAEAYFSEETVLEILPKDISAFLQRTDMTSQKRNEMVEHFNAYASTEDAIFKHPLPKDRRKEVETLADVHRSKQQLQQYIERLQEKTRRLLITLQESDDFENTGVFKSVLKRYSMLLESSIVPSKKYGLRAVALPFGGKPKENLLLRAIKDDRGQDELDLRPEYLNECISYCVVEYLRQPGNYGGKRIKKCPYCDLFFIAKDKKRQRCYEADCGKRYEKQKKQKQRDIDPVSMQS